MKEFLHTVLMDDQCSESPAQTAERVAGAISGAHFALVALMEQVHGQTASSGRRAILLNLKSLGPKTVPQLAAMRPVSRQYVQRLVDGLALEGLVEKRSNAARRRSPAFALTASGEDQLAAMLARERPVIEALGGTLNPPAAEALIAALDQIRGRVRRILAEAVV